MHGLIIQYTYRGDEEAWGLAISTFIKHIDEDARLKGAFRYRVMKGKKDPSVRIHNPQWDNEETLAHVQSKPWFKEFAEQVKAFAGDSLQTIPVLQEFDSQT